MEITKTLYVKNKKEWRVWLAKNAKKENEIWLIRYRKSSGKPTLPYNDSVDEALCFGWIDSTAKAIDNEKYAQRFTPRRKTSVLSQLNKERVRKLIAEKRMTKAGLDAISHVFDSANDVPHDFIIPNDILAEIKKNKDAWSNFQKFPEDYKRIRIAYIEHRRKTNMDDFRKRLDYFIKMTAQNKRFGITE